MLLDRAKQPVLKFDSPVLQWHINSFSAVNLVTGLESELMTATFEQSCESSTTQMLNEMIVDSGDADKSGFQLSSVLKKRKKKVLTMHSAYIFPQLPIHSSCAPKMHPNHPLVHPLAN